MYHQTDISSFPKICDTISSKHNNLKRFWNRLQSIKSADKATVQFVVNNLVKLNVNGKNNIIILKQDNK